MYLLKRICVDDKEIHSTMYSKFNTLCGAQCLRALMPSVSSHHQLRRITAAEPAAPSRNNRRLFKRREGRTTQCAPCAGLFHCLCTFAAGRAL